MNKNEFNAPEGVCVDETLISMLKDYVDQRIRQVLEKKQNLQEFHAVNGTIKKNMDASSTINQVLTIIGEDVKTAFSDTLELKLLLSLCSTPVSKSKLAKSLNIPRSQFSPSYGTNPKPARALKSLVRKEFVICKENDGQHDLWLSSKGSRLKKILTCEIDIMNSI